MARRIRSIKPEILDDEVTAALPHLEWRLFVSLWLLADDYGNLHGHAAQIKGSALWRTPDSEQKVRAALDHLAKPGVELIRRYSVRGQPYIQIVGWAKHQKVDHPGKAVIPGPDRADETASRGPVEVSRDSRETLAPDQDLGSGPGEDQGDGESPASPALFPAGTLAAEPAIDGGQAKPARTRKQKQPPPAVNPEPTDADRATAVKHGVELEREWPAMWDYHRREGKGSADWSASWRTWCANAARFAAERSARGRDGPAARASPTRPKRGLSALLDDDLEP